MAVPYESILLYQISRLHQMKTGSQLDPMYPGHIIYVHRSARVVVSCSVNQSGGSALYDNWSNLPCNAQDFCQDFFLVVVSYNVNQPGGGSALATAVGPTCNAKRSVALVVVSAGWHLHLQQLIGPHPPVTPRDLSRFPCCGVSRVAAARQLIQAPLTQAQRSA
jgi:hypothetical protein